MSLFRREERAVSYQDVWGSGGDWQAALGRVGLLDSVALPTVHRCLMILAGMVAQMEPRTLRGAGRTRAEVTPEPAFIRSPSNTLDAYEWRFAGTVSLALCGEQTGLVLAEDGAGYPTAVEWVWPTRFTNDNPAFGAKPRWFLDGGEVPASRVWHRRNFTMPGKVRGVDPLSQAGLLEVARAARNFGKDWFENGATPSMVLSSQRDLTANEADTLKARVVAASKRRRPVVIPAWIGVEQVKVTAEESQFLETQMHAKADIATALGIPGDLVGASVSGKSVTYANRDQRIQDLLVTTLNHYITVWNRSLTAALPEPMYVRLNPGVILRSDLKTRMEAYRIAAEVQRATGNRIYTEDEERDLEDREPLPPAEIGTTAREIAEAIQKIYLGVGKVITADEAREIINRLGLGLPALNGGFDDA